MKTVLFTSSMLLALLAAAPAYAAEEAKCQELFAKADTNKDGTVGGQEINADKAALTEAGIENPTEDMVITKAQFLEACMKK